MTREKVISVLSSLLTTQTHTVFSLICNSSKEEEKISSWKMSLTHSSVPQLDYSNKFPEQPPPTHLSYSAKKLQRASVFIEKQTAAQSALLFFHLPKMIFTQRNCTLSSCAYQQLPRFCYSSSRFFTNHAYF